MKPWTKLKTILGSFLKRVGENDQIHEPVAETFITRFAEGTSMLEWTGKFVFCCVSVRCVGITSQETLQHQGLQEPCGDNLTFWKLSPEILSCGHFPVFPRRFLLPRIKAFQQDFKQFGKFLTFFIRVFVEGSRKMKVGCIK